MSGFVSSVINKSGKRLAPKAPSRRRPTPQATESAQESAEATPQRLRSETPSAVVDTRQSISANESEAAPREAKESTRVSTSIGIATQTTTHVDVQNETSTGAAVDDDDDEGPLQADEAGGEARTGRTVIISRPNKRRKIADDSSNANGADAIVPQTRGESAAPLTPVVKTTAAAPASSVEPAAEIRSNKAPGSSESATTGTTSNVQTGRRSALKPRPVARPRTRAASVQAQENAAPAEIEAPVLGEQVSSTDTEVAATQNNGDVRAATAESNIATVPSTQDNTETAATTTNEDKTTSSTTATAKKRAAPKSSASKTAPKQPRQPRTKKRKASEIQTPDATQDGATESQATSDQAQASSSTSIGRNRLDHAKSSQSQPQASNEMGETSAPVRKKRKYTKRKPAVQAPETSTQTATPASTERGKAAASTRATKSTRPRTRASRRAAEERGSPATVDGADDGAGATDEPEQTDATAPRKKRKRRDETPEGASDYEVDPKKVTMDELCKATKFGKKSTRGLEMQNIDFAEVVRLRKQAEARAREELLNNDTPAVNNAREENAQQEAAVAVSGPRLKLVNGQMVVDNSSLLIERQAEEDTTGEAQTINKLTEFRNSHSWLYKDRRDPMDRFQSAHQPTAWSKEGTEQFYEALRMFGTDFEMIAQMFPGRTRRNIKNKFVREERLDPMKIKAALIGENVPMDLATFAQATGRDESDYRDPAALEEELREVDERERAEIEKQKEEMAEILRQRQEVATAKAAKAAANKAARAARGTTKTKKRRTAPSAAQASAGTEPGENDGRGGSASPGVPAED